jgi:hypothetical protein
LALMQVFPHGWPLVQCLQQACASCGASIVSNEADALSRPGQGV